jgi:hypothetical protein
VAVSHPEAPGKLTAAAGVGSVPLPPLLTVITTGAGAVPFATDVKASEVEERRMAGVPAAGGPPPEEPPQAARVSVEKRIRARVGRVTAPRSNGLSAAGHVLCARDGR